LAFTTAQRPRMRFVRISRSKVTGRNQWLAKSHGGARVAALSVTAATQVPLIYVVATQVTFHISFGVCSERRIVNDRTCASYGLDDWSATSQLPCQGAFRHMSREFAPHACATAQASESLGDGRAIRCLPERHHLRVLRVRCPAAAPQVPGP